jgi:hypothetical protein
MIDDHHREGLSIEAGFSLPTIRVIQTLEQLLEWGEKSVAIQCDNGPKFIRREFNKGELPLLPPYSQLRKSGGYRFEIKKQP